MVKKANQAKHLLNGTQDFGVQQRLRVIQASVRRSPYFEVKESLYRLRDEASLSDQHKDIEARARALKLVDEAIQQMETLHDAGQALQEDGGAPPPVAEDFEFEPAKVVVEVNHP